MVCQHRYGKIRGLLAVARPADNCPVPVPENPQTNPAGVINLVEANGHTVARHILQASAKVADGVGSTGLRCDGQHPGLEGLKFLTGQTGVRLIEGQVPVDADAAEAHVHTAQLFDEIGNVVYVVGVRKHPVILGHIQLGVDLGVDRPVHKAPEAQRMLHGNPLFVVAQVLVHVNEPAVFQADSLAVDHVHKIGILADGTYRANENRGFALFILFLDKIRHFPGDDFEHGGLIRHDLHGDFGGAEQLCLVIVVVFVMHTVYLSFSVILK